ncbi:transcriptional regulator [Halorussus salinisoli]|uniref:transcriptional regulator n=1 Tax=Halorussus salinisoli TaxID=2558242 RepID=UPI002A910B4B|nr:transcriptional regulator [Halorussus salinisoli]
MAINTNAMPNNERDTDTGQFTEKHPPEDFTNALEELGSAGTRDIADEVGCPYRTAHHKLTKLEEVGRVESQKVGNAKLWSLSED